jgi:hypothetical protein
MVVRAEHTEEGVVAGMEPGPLPMVCLEQQTLEVEEEAVPQSAALLVLVVLVWFRLNIQFIKTSARL